MSSPARDQPSRFMMKASGTGQALVFKNGEMAGIYAFGLVVRSALVDGRTYTDSQGKTRQLKEIEIALVMQEGERFLGMLCMAAGGKNHVLSISGRGGITFSTKHTTIDEDGEEIEGSTSMPMTAIVCH